jgi:hypothetical protein
MRGVFSFVKSLGIKNFRPALYSWFFNFLFTVFIYYGYYRVFSIPAGNTLIQEETGGQISTFTFLADILQHYKGSLPLIFSLALVFTMAFLLVSIYASTGIYTVLVENEKPTFTNLIANSTQNFFSMLKVFLINLVNFFIALIFPVFLLIIFFKVKMFTSNESTITFFFYVWIAVTTLFCVFSIVVYDYSRIYKLKEDKNVLYSLRKGISFTFSNKINILSLFILYAISLVIIYLVYSILIGIVINLFYAFLIFFFYQGFIIVRYYLKIVVMRAEINLMVEPD